MTQPRIPMGPSGGQFTATIHKEDAGALSLDMDSHSAQGSWLHPPTPLTAVQVRSFWEGQQIPDEVLSAFPAHYGAARSKAFQARVQEHYTVWLEEFEGTHTVPKKMFGRKDEFARKTEVKQAWETEITRVKFDLIDRPHIKEISRYDYRALIRSARMYENAPDKDHNPDERAALLAIQIEFHDGRTMSLEQVWAKYRLVDHIDWLQDPATLEKWETRRVIEALDEVRKSATRDAALLEEQMIDIAKVNLGVDP